MKGGTHPKYMVCKVTCACGNTFETLSLREELKIDICANCHPFYTGKQKFVDTAGRVQKFEKRFKWSDDLAKLEATKKSAAQKKKKKVEKPKKVGKQVKKTEKKAGKILTKDKNQKPVKIEKPTNKETPKKTEKPKPKEESK